MEYPTNREGLPLHPAELGFGTGARGEYNNHHMAFYERTFGAIAITQTFRDLESMQVQMPIPEHVRLHQRYEGLKLPHFITMLDKIWDDREQGLGLNMRLDGKYRHYPITDDLWANLMQEYSTYGEHSHGTSYSLR